MKSIDDLPRLKGYVSLREWSKDKGVSRAHAHMLVRNGSVPGLRIGEQIVIPEGTDFPVSPAMTRQSHDYHKRVAERNNKPLRVPAQVVKP